MTAILNKFLFPIPKPAHYTSHTHKNHLLWLPPTSSSDVPIPCMFYHPDNPNRKPEFFIIFCHGNGCDLGSMHNTLTQFSRDLNTYILSFEYPSYGICTGLAPNQHTINHHADRAFNFVRNNLHWPRRRIIIFGHSIGSGPACHIASHQPTAALILQSPYTAIETVVREKIGMFAGLVDSRSWNNLEAMKHIQCPVLFIHGINDTLIPPRHSELLHQACANTSGKKLVLLRNEDHNSMTDATLLKYIRPFFEKLQQSIDTTIKLPTVKIESEFRQHLRPGSGHHHHHHHHHHNAQKYLNIPSPRTPSTPSPAHIAQGHKEIKHEHAQIK